MFAALSIFSINKKGLDSILSLVRQRTILIAYPVSKLLIKLNCLQLN